MSNEQNKLAVALQDASCLTATENGDLSFSSDTIDNPWIKLFYEVSSFRARVAGEYRNAAGRYALLKKGDDDVLSAYRAALNATQGTALEGYGVRLALYVRDIAQGMGERSLGRAMLAELVRRGLIDPERLVDVIGRQGYGRWDDLVEIAQLVGDGSASDRIEAALVAQLRADDAALRHDGASANVSLLAKWMPSIATSSSFTRRRARRYMQLLGLDNRGYRCLLSALRRHLDVVERKITARQWNQIVYEHVPSKASLRYAQVFLEHDKARYEAFLSAVKKGEVAMHADTLTAPEIMAKVRLSRHDKEQDGRALELLWQALPKLELAHNVLPVCDVSGSMYVQVGALQAIDVSTGLAFYLAQSNTGAFKNLVMSFSSDCRINDLSTKTTLYEKLDELEQYEGYTTDIGRALYQLLQLAKTSGATQAELPALVFFSDMEFDDFGPDDRGLESTFQYFQRQFEAIGLKMPEVVFWNICNRSETVPLRRNDLGMVLCSGFSQQIMRAVLSGDFPTPWDMLKETLDQERWSVLDAP